MNEQLHRFNAMSAQAEVNTGDPSNGSLNFGLSNGDVLHLTMSRDSLETVRHEIDRALREITTRMHP